jgi:hypothetical protein
MSADVLWLSHDLFPDRDVKIAGESYRQRRCRRCHRNFVMMPGIIEWAAVHVSVFKFVLLDCATNERWLAEGCPGTVGPLP